MTQLTTKDASRTKRWDPSVQSKIIGPSYSESFKIQQLWRLHSASMDARKHKRQKTPYFPGGLNCLFFVRLFVVVVVVFFSPSLPTTPTQAGQHRHSYPCTDFTTAPVLHRLPGKLHELTPQKAISCTWATRVKAQHQ